MSEWKEYKLADLCTKIGSGATPRGGGESYKDTGVSLIRSQNVLDFQFSYNGLAFIDDEQADDLKNVIVQENDVLLNITGDSVARVCKVPKKVLPARVNQHVAIIRSDEKQLNSNFLLYYLLKLKEHLLSISEIGATRRAITKGMIENLEIYIPEINEQTAIASVLSSLDDKIDLLHRQNTTLEKMAETLFRQWFVEEAKEEWEFKQLKEITDIAIGRTPPRKESKWFSTNPKDIKWISIKDLGADGVFISNTSEYLTKEAVETFNIPLIPKDTVVLSFKMTVGRVAITFEEMLSNEAIAHFKFNNKTPFSKEYLYTFLKTYKYETLGSTSSIVTAINSAMIKEMEILIPDEFTMNAFKNETESLFNKIKTNQTQIRTLTALRDTLLPKLMSGEVRVNTI
jgi:type I restriction enzyme, S subunit